MDGVMVTAGKRATTNSKSLVRAPVVGSAKVMATTKENVRNQGKGPRKMMQAQANMELHKGDNQVVANLVVANQVVANLVVANKCQGNQVVANKCLANQVLAKEDLGNKEVGNLDLQEAVVVVVELVERRSNKEWQDAVAVIRGLCVQDHGKEVQLGI